MGTSGRKKLALASASRNLIGGPAADKSRAFQFHGFSKLG